MAISKADCWSFIFELVTRNPNLGIPALEDVLFENLLIVDYTYIYILYLFLKRREKGREKAREGESLVL